MRWQGGVFAVAMAMALSAPVAAQKGERLDAPASPPLGVAGLGQDGSAAVGVGLRLFGLADAPEASPGKPGGTAEPAAPPAGGKPAATPVGTRTAFQPSPAVSERVRQQILASTPNLTPQLRQAIQAGTPWVEFDRLLRQHGYSSNDLADVVAAFYLVAWEVATGADALAQPAGIAAVRTQMRGLLAGLPAVAAMDEAQRQYTAELLAFYSMVIAARTNELRRQGAAGQAALVQHREQVSAQMRQQGVDLRRFGLTPDGFSARR